MVSPLPVESRSRLVDILDSMALLQNSRAPFGDRYRPVEKRR